MTSIASHLPSDRPQVAFVAGTAQSALATLDRVGQVAAYTSSVTYASNGFAQALKAVAGSMVRGIGTRVFYVTTGGFDTHSAQNPNQNNGSYFNLMATLNDALFAFYTDLTNQGLLGDTGIHPAEALHLRALREAREQRGRKQVRADAHRLLERHRLQSVQHRHAGRRAERAEQRG